MYKREDDKKHASKMKKTIIRNWVICGVSLALAILCYYFVK